MKYIEIKLKSQVYEIWLPFEFIKYVVVFVSEIERKLANLSGRINILGII